MAVFPLPVVFKSKDLAPIAVFPEAVFVYKALNPIAVQSEAVSSKAKEFVPTAVLEEPVVFLSMDICPIATL
jgi:hypothetical protein